MNPKVDFYFDKEEKWKKEIEYLRELALDCNLQEELKWGCPCYTSDKKNVVLIHVFKDYCALLFFKGALLQDTHGLLIQQTENVQAARQIRFSNLKEISEKQAIIKSYVFQAIEVEKAGLKVELKKTSEFAAPIELTEKMEKDAAFRNAFEALTPGRQRAYILHFSAPKQEKTRLARIEKSADQIFKGKGLND